jgi:potassium/hydrogen antiporter
MAMDVVTFSLLAVSLILFFGFFAEFIFRKFQIPDVLFLIILGFVLGPFVLGYITPQDVASVAPIFTTFALVFLLFDGAFNINLSSLIREFSESFLLTIFNFALSTLVIMIVMVASGFSFLVSLLTGFLLGGVSSSFVIPVLKEMKISEKLYSLLTLESALTDVFCIVFSLTVIELITIGTFAIQKTLAQIASLFAVAGLIGVLAGVLWIILIARVFNERNYMVTIAYLLAVYVLTQFLHGNGAIAALFFGLMLKNSKQLSSIIKGILSKKSRVKKKALKGELGVNVTTNSEQFFYHQVSFFLKTFFFVYIGILINLSDWKALIVGIIISFLLLGSRMASIIITKKMDALGKSLVNSVFARGLAAAAVAQVAIQAGIPGAEFIANVAYVVITGTIILSSARLFIHERRFPAPVEE